MNLEAEQHLAHLYNLYNQERRATSRNLPSILVPVNIGAAVYSLIIDPGSPFAYHYRQLYGWPVGLLAMVPANGLMNRWENASYRRRVGIVTQIASLQGREVGESNPTQPSKEIDRAEAVVNLAFNVRPGLFYTKLFDLGYKLNKRFRWSDNEYEFQIKKTLETFDRTAGVYLPLVEFDAGTKAEIVRDALIMHKTRLLEEISKSKISDRTRVYAGRLAAEINDRLSNYPPYISHQSTDH
ncbi:hypothetical protein M1563_04690 [Patescibacteria group bacterium]|nr:hypothetical protein [Patescibacteria group bacterium]MCL5409549.1 hypothetical protein [Patescibacteria group bacterium]